MEGIIRKQHLDRTLHRCGTHIENTQELVTITVSNTLNVNIVHWFIAASYYHMIALINVPLFKKSAAFTRQLGDLFHRKIFVDFTLVRFDVRLIAKKWYDCLLANPAWKEAGLKVQIHWIFPGLQDVDLVRSEKAVE